MSETGANTGRKQTIRITEYVCPREILYLRLRTFYLGLYENVTFTCASLGITCVSQALPTLLTYLVWYTNRPFQIM